MVRGTHGLPRGSFLKVAVEFYFFGRGRKKIFYFQSGFLLLLYRDFRNFRSFFSSSPYANLPPPKRKNGVFY